jgi:hypothetical protein
MPLFPSANHVPDRLLPARWLLLAAGAFTCLALGAAAFTVSTHERSANRKCAELARTLHLSSPALIPSGRFLRHPETALRGIDWRFSPRLPVMAPGADEWLRSIPEPER